MTDRRSLILVLCLIVPFLVRGQSTDQWIAWGDAAMERREYYGASRFYGEALSSDPGRLALQWKHAEAARLSNQYDKAAEQYDRVYRKDQGRTYPNTLRWLAEMQMSQGLYDEAEKSWRKLIQREKKKNPFNVARAENALIGCTMAKADSVDTTSIGVEHLPQPMNSYESEFAPRIAADEMLYFSSLRGEFTKDEEVKDTAEYRTRIYRTSLANDIWTDPQAAATTINGEGDNANITWSSDGSKAYFTRCVEDKCRIFWIRLHDPEAQAKPLAGLGEGSSTQPMMVQWEDREMLLFVSDREDGAGGSDIWQAQIIGDSAQFVIPVNGKVNSIGNERTPWFDPIEGRLYFSSDFLPGLGGFDIFHSDLRNDEFSEPVNAGKPLNSPANDLYPSIDPKRKYFWFASNRIGSLAAKGATCCSDLYRYPLEKDLIVQDNDTISPDTATTSSYQTTIAAIKDRFPVVLYFHNDDPDPKSWEKGTDQTYEQAYQRYRSLLPEYAKHEDPDRLNAFFNEHVDAGRTLLNELIDAIIPALQNGDRVILSVRGFASPLAKNDYNRNLSQRRISSLHNHLRTVNNGILQQFMNDSSATGGRLEIQELPFGEERSATSVSDDLNDLQRSVYSVEAMRERRIEIEEIQILTAKNVTEEISLVQNVGDLKQDEEKLFTFTLKNTGKKPLELTRTQADCGCTTAHLPADAIPPNGSAEVKIHFNGRAPLGPITRSVTIFTNGEPKTFRLTIEGEIVN